MLKAEQTSRYGFPSATMIESQTMTDVYGRLLIFKINKPFLSHKRNTNNAISAQQVVLVLYSREAYKIHSFGKV